MRNDLRVQRGTGLQALRTALGTSFVNGAQAGTFRHPWFTTAQWSPGTRQWLATVQAGFVNDDAPIFRTTVTEQTAQGRQFGNNPLSGEPYFSSSVFAPDRTAPPLSRTLELPLYLAPLIPLTNWRELGADGNGGVPGFFAARGVTPPEEDVPSDQVRQLRAIDLILHQPRPALTAQISIDGGLGGTTIARQVLALRFPLPGDVLRVYAGNFQAPAAIDPLAGIYEESAWDELVISTIYLLSPPGVTPGTAPDGTWTPYVQHGLFWNVSWIPAPPFNSVDLSADANALTGAGALGGGLLLPIVNEFAAAANDLEQMALNLITAHSQAGTWWTPTGGGHIGTLQSTRVKASAGLNGLDRTGRLQAARRAEAGARLLAAQQAAGLDPVFPHRAIGFDPARLRAASFHPIPLS